VTVKIKDFDFRIRQASRTLPHAVDSDRAVTDVARELLARLRAGRRVPARLVGVALSGLGPAGAADSSPSSPRPPSPPSIDRPRPRRLAAPRRLGRRGHGSR
jgi:hypothetical protein